MLASISPLGERARSSRWSLTVAAYVVASTLAGAMLGSVLGAAGALTPASWRLSAVGLVILAGLVLAGLAVDRRFGGLALPSLRRQVDRSHLERYRGWVVGVGYGAQLGAGVLTIVTSSTTYVALLLALWTGSPVAGALVGVVFGAVRAAPVVGLRAVHRPADLHRVFALVTRAAVPIDRLAQGTLLLTGIVLLGAATLRAGGRI